MTREPILQPPAPSGDDDRALRPQNMDEMVGQREVYARLQIAVEAATKREESLGHILFDGPPGLGKTTFAMCIPRNMGVPIQIASGLPKENVVMVDDGTGVVGAGARRRCRGEVQQHAAEM